MTKKKGKVVLADGHYVSHYYYGLIAFYFWSVLVATLDYFIPALPFNSFCMNQSSFQPTLSQILVYILILLPYSIIGIYTLVTDWQQHLLKTPQTAQQPLLQQIPFRSILFSFAILIANVTLYSAFEIMFWLLRNSTKLVIIFAFIFVTVDIVKVPGQLFFTFRKNDQNQKRTRGDRRQAAEEHARQERIEIAETAV